MNSCTTSIKIWEDHSDKLKAFICSKVNGDDNCHDILHDLFLKIRENEERIKWIEQPASYVIKMAQNAIIDYYRSQKKTLQPLQSDYISDEEQLSEIQLADCCLLSFIKALPPLYSEALILTELEGFSQKHLAEKLNISYTGVKSRVQRARKMLKQAILDCCPYQFDKYGNIIGCCK
ncbi:sigma-70 family RNA polymerase sigma factor [Panacibacter ginsenosidivorans]|uniref:Sigma-70 family RNA polymerase sigma factor n=1 Tax=Panacibacter ginsenosidivorans TaxID=1813871 RepID=A0A5B8VDZ1_9BACT|nr:sigma-70 family RNA polymerase sigma factor [Panacibacter ginsenosidivorans]QEC69255.1 sigma-70 family RNA polymerase sigma factor [Panacibacter ginsenosidivorans]